jgi:DNA invertase Pin-like site-specific DNA recombinase
MKIGYARVSTGPQDLQLQLDALDRAGVDPRDVWQEKASGASLAKRKVFQAMMKDVRQGDVVVVWKLDRLARNTLDLYNTVEQIMKKGATLEVITTPGMDTNTPVGKAMFGMLGVFAEFERALAYERTMAGLAAAKAAGRIGGSKSKFTDEQVLETRHMMKADGARKLGMSQAGYTKRLEAALKREVEKGKNDAAA